MSYKTGKLLNIVRQFDKTNGKYEINGVDTGIAVFLYRKEREIFQPIPRGNYNISRENNNTFLNVDTTIDTQAIEYQIIYETDINSSEYKEAYPELKVLVQKYNEVAKDVSNINKYLKTTGVKTDADPLHQSQVLPQLERNTFWYLNENGIIGTFPLGKLNQTYEKMVVNLRKDIEILINNNKENSLNDITTFSRQKIDEFIIEVSNGVKNMNNTYQEIENKINNSIHRFSKDEENKVREFQSVLENKINDLNDLKNSIIQDLNIKKNILSENLRDTIISYIKENKEMFKGEKGDKGDTGAIENTDGFEPKIFNKKSGFNLDKTDDLNTDDSNKLATAKAIKILYNELKEKIENLDLCPYKVGDIYVTTKIEDPSTIWKNTSWTRLTGRFLKGTELNETAGQLGGSNTKTLSISNLPSHNHSATADTQGWHTHTQDSHAHTQPSHTHTINAINSGGWGIGEGLSRRAPGSATSFYPTNSSGGENTGLAQPSIHANGSHTHNISIGYTGDGRAFDITPLYYSVNIWKRIG